MILEGQNFRNVVVFVESPNKTQLFHQVFSKVLTKNKIYVLSTKGHIVDIKVRAIEHPDQKLDIKYKPYAETIGNKLAGINYSPELDLLIIATDPDREGEAIGWHLLRYIESRFSQTAQYIRIRCNSLTYNNIVQNIENLENNGKINMKLVEVYFARLFVDILIGINGSELLWNKLYGCRSMGRVQSIVTYMLFQRELMIQDFIPEIYTKVNVKFPEFENCKIDKILFNQKDASEITEEEKKALMQEFNNTDFEVTEISDTIRAKQPILPLDIATLSAIANQEFNFSIQEVYKICQKLYEGVEVNGSKIGLITYMRTDSREISKDFIPKIHEFISKYFGDTNINTSITSSKKNNFAQEAHEAIRITDLSLNIKSIIDNLNIQERKIANKIFYHTIAPFINLPKYNRRCFILVNKNVKIYVSSYKTTEDGYYILNDYLTLDRPKQQFVDWKQGQKIRTNIDLTEETTKNHDRYTEGSLISEMKKLGIGRPSTYAYICNIIKNRLYSTISSRKYYLVSAGFILSWFIKIFLQDVINYEFTAQMEQMLDDIVAGNKTKKDVLHIFFENIHSKLTLISRGFDRESIISKIQHSIYNQYGKTCSKCNQKYHLRFIRSKAKIICEGEHIYNLYEFGYKNDSYLQNTYDADSKFKKLTYTKQKYKPKKSIASDTVLPDGDLHNN